MTRLGSMSAHPGSRPGALTGQRFAGNAPVQMPGCGGSSASAISTTARAWAMVVSMTGTGLSSACTSRPNSVQAKTMTSAPRATRSVIAAWNWARVGAGRCLGQFGVQGVVHVVLVLAFGDQDGQSEASAQP